MDQAFRPKLLLMQNPKQDLVFLLQYNSFVCRRDADRKRECHNKARETPLPIYIGLTLHAKTCSRDLVEKLRELGLSISYDRVLTISTDLGNSICRQCHQDDVVCPLSLRKGLFTSSAVDNINHNPSSTTAHDSFHGTGVSLFQQPTAQVPGVCRNRVSLNQATSTGKVSFLNYQSPTTKFPQFYFLVRIHLCPWCKVACEEMVRLLQKQLQKNLNGWKRGKKQFQMLVRVCHRKNAFHGQSISQTKMEKTKTLSLRYDLCCPSFLTTRNQLQ